MFFVKCGSDFIHDPTGKRPGCLLAEPVLNMAVGRQGSFSFKMPPTHPMYGQLHDRTSYLAVLDDNGEIWRGRVISQEKGWENLISVYAEGELAYLQDTVMRPYVFSGTRKEFLRILIRNHKEQLTATDISIPSLDSPRKFTLDLTNSDVDSDPISVTISDGDSTWSLIDEYIIRAGYYPVTYKSGDTVYIKFVSDFPDSTQEVRFAENLLDLTSQRNAADVITKLIPYGATLEPGDSEYEQKPQSGDWHGNRRTIRNAAAGDGSDIIKNNAARLIFGDIVGIKVYNDITGADELYAAASADLDKMVSEAITISARAVDISLINGSTPLRVGYYHTTYSPLHGVNLKLLCSEAEIDLSSPDKSTYEFGAGQKTLTDLQTQYGGGGGGGSVTPASIVTATGSMTAEQKAQTRENIGAGEPLTPQQIADGAGAWLEDNLATPSTPPIDSTLSVENAAADAKATGDAVGELKSALNIINPPLDITWTLGTGINSTGDEYRNGYTAATNAIYASPGDVFATDSPTTDGNGKFIVYYVCEYAGSVFKKRTEFTSSVRSVVIGADTDNIRVVFGRYSSSGISITQADIDTYVSIEFTQKAGAASLVKALADKVDNLDTDSFIINRYAYQGNDVNDIAENTFYFCAEGTINNPSTQSGYFIQTILYRSDAAAAMQIAYRFDNGLIYYRRKVTGTWRSWHCVSSHSIPSDPLYYAFGDSLTYGAVWTPKEEAPYYQITQASVTNQIPTRIANAIGAAGNYQNKGVGGAYFVGTGNNKIITAIQNTGLTNAKIITVAGGRNDSENPLGDKNSTVGDGTICGAIKEILEYLTNTYKQLQIVWIGVTPNTRDNSTVFTRVFAGGWSLNTFDEKVSELCAEYGVPYVNWKECTYIRHWADFSGAGDVYSHPNNENSYLQMGNYIAGKVSAFYKG